MADEIVTLWGLPVALALLAIGARLSLSPDWIASGYPQRVDRVTDLSWLFCELFLLLAACFFISRQS